FLIHDGARTGGALLSLVAEGRNSDALDGFVQVGIGIDNDGVFAAHFGDHALDPDLAGLMLRSQLVDAQSYVARTGEGDEAGLGMLDQEVADGGAAAGKEAERSLRESGLEQHFGELGRDGRSLARRLEDY